ncbi:hydantoinase B/oxoprolinase family protein [Bacillus sp. Marseille-P3661]|uniref:hydantoinase B/oxoprolinase family protein n=1 Tax=Bacillus sp. Marseille-P3661 TaxID=1936234 RepID=UPI000C815B94|nr:hydantoinase B/oxoprolinase family protein [Bacillus sp. Marseille-P3661]
MINPITLEVLSYRLNEVVSMMEHLLFHSGYSPILRESQDGSACILDWEGKVVTGSGAPYHLFPYHRTAQTIIKKFGSKMKPGDSFLVNDPYTSGNFHVPDMAIVTPVFYHSELIAFCASIAHKPDLGGLVPGSSSADAREIYHEGLLVPGVLIWNDSGINSDIESILRGNSRTPNEVVGDIRAQVGATRMGLKRLQEMCDEYGKDMLMTGFKEIMVLSEKRIRKELSLLPNGSHEAEAFMDNDGVTLNKPVRIHVKITKQGENIEFDYSESNKQVDGPVNVRPQSVETASVLALIGILDPTIPINDGIRKVVRFINPEGRVTNAKFPAPVNNYYPTTHLMYSCVQKAMASFCNDRVVAPAGLGIGGTSIGYPRARSGKPGVQYELANTSLGATSENDGVFGTLAMNHITPSTPVEVLETEYPLVVKRWEPIKDSAGAGEYRGGLGFVREYLLLDEAKFTVRMGHFKKGSWGVNGGRASQKGSVVINPGTETEICSSPLATYNLKSGDLIRIQNAGGSGYGNPHERDPKMVLRDVKNGYISIQAALQDYGVVINEGEMKVDEEETRKKRQSLK